MRLKAKPRASGNHDACGSPPPTALHQSAERSSRNAATNGSPQRPTAKQGASTNPHRWASLKLAWKSPSESKIPRVNKPAMAFVFNHIIVRRCMPKPNFAGETGLEAEASRGSGDGSSRAAATSVNSKSMSNRCVACWRIRSSCVAISNACPHRRSSSSHDLKVLMDASSRPASGSSRRTKAGVALAKGGQKGGKNSHFACLSLRKVSDQIVGAMGQSKGTQERCDVNRSTASCHGTMQVFHHHFAAEHAVF